jgi:OmpA-OmpF porin, OOP family
MTKKILLTCVILLSIASIASARPYFGLGGMAVFLEDADVSGNVLSGEASFDTGWGAMIFAGQQFEAFRLEAEIAYRRNDLDRIEVGIIDTSRSGKVEAMSAMFNAYLDFAQFRFRPFIGVGAGGARIEAEFEGVDDRDTVFAYQGIAGFSFGDGLEIGYRYFATEDPRFNGVKGEYSSHNVFLAIRF